jgi:hypothetical protein
LDNPEQFAVAIVRPPPTRRIPFANVEVAVVVPTFKADTERPPAKVLVELSPNIVVVAVPPTVILESADRFVVEALIVKIDEVAVSAPVVRFPAAVVEPYEINPAFNNRVVEVAAYGETAKSKTGTEPNVPTSSS